MVDFDSTTTLASRSAVLQRIVSELWGDGTTTESSARASSETAALLLRLHANPAALPPLPIDLLEASAHALRSGLAVWRGAAGRLDAEQRSCAACVWLISRSHPSRAALGLHALCEALHFGSESARPQMLRLLGTLGRAAWSDAALRTALSRSSAPPAQKRTRRRAAAPPRRALVAEEDSDACAAECGDWVRAARRHEENGAAAAAAGGEGERDAPRWLRSGALLDSLGDGDARVRAAAAEAIGRAVVWTADSALVATAVEALASALRDQGDAVQQRAAAALGTLLYRHAAAASTPSVLRALSDALRSGGGEDARRVHAGHAAVRAAALCTPSRPAELMRLAADVADVAARAPSRAHDVARALRQLGRRNVGLVWLASVEADGAAATSRGGAMLPHVGAEFIALYVGAAEVDCAILGALPAALRGAARKSAQTLAAQHPQPSAATVHRTLCVALASLGKPALRQQRRLLRFSAAATCVRAHRERVASLALHVTTFADDDATTTADVERCAWGGSVRFVHAYLRCAEALLLVQHEVTRRGGVAERISAAASGRLVQDALALVRCTRGLERGPEIALLDVALFASLVDLCRIGGDDDVDNDDVMGGGASGGVKRKALRSLDERAEAALAARTRTLEVTASSGKDNAGAERLAAWRALSGRPAATALRVVPCPAARAWIEACTFAMPPLDVLLPNGLPRLRTVYARVEEVEWSAGKRAARGAAAVPPTVRVHGSVHDLRGGPSGASCLRGDHIVVVLRIAPSERGRPLGPEPSEHETVHSFEVAPSALLWKPLSVHCFNVVGAVAVAGVAATAAVGSSAERQRWRGSSSSSVSSGDQTRAVALRVVLRSRDGGGVDVPLCEWQHSTTSV